MPAPALDDVVKAMGAATDALAAGEPGQALPFVEWAKQAAPRAAVVREALGITHYQLGDFPAAQRELLAYRRLSGQQDQNHLLADCARAAGRMDNAQAYVEEMLAAGVSGDRAAEGLIVLASAHADRGDLQGGLQILERAGLDPDHVEPWHPRLWYVAGDLYDRIGDSRRARDYFEAILAVDADFPLVTERLAALGD